VIGDGDVDLESSAIDRSKPSVCRSGWWNTRRSARLVSMAIAVTASQIADQTVAAARTDAARIIQEAQRAHDRSRTEAEAAAEEQVRVAAAETADVGVLHAEITPINRDSLLGQYYRDRIGAILRKVGHMTTVDMRGGQSVIVQGPDE
jgi:hypothetical protein